MKCSVYQYNDEGLCQCNTQCVSVMMVCFNAMASVMMKVCASVAMGAISQDDEVMQ